MTLVIIHGHIISCRKATMLVTNNHYRAFNKPNKNTLAQFTFVCLEVALSTWKMGTCDVIKQNGSEAGNNLISEVLFPLKICTHQCYNKTFVAHT